MRTGGSTADGADLGHRMMPSEAPARGLQHWGGMPELTRDPGSDFHLVACADPVNGVDKVLRLVTERIPAPFRLDPVPEVQVLCPMNRGGLGAWSLNIDLHRALNPPGEIGVERFGWVFSVGDRVMQAENDYDKDV